MTARNSLPIGVIRGVERTNLFDIPLLVWYYILCINEEKSMYITKEEQQALFREFNTPPHVQRHCNEVARVARILAENLNKHGYNIDVDAVYGAAMVHDVVRVMERHDLEGAKILEARNHPQEAAMVRLHMTYSPFHPVDELKEIDVLCLADRTVREDEYVGIDRRMDYLLQKPNVDERRRAGIQRVREDTRVLIQQIEERLGCSLMDLFTKDSEAVKN